MADPICLLVVTDGRLDLLDRTIASLDRYLVGPIASRLIQDDTGDDELRAEVRRRHPGWGLVVTPGRSGFGGAYRHAWLHVCRHVTERWLFSTEDDFELLRPVNLSLMQAVMGANPQVLQMALQRQAWSAPEIDHGGVIGLNPAAYHDRETFVDVDAGGPADVAWLEHRQFWTTNPSLHRTEVCQLGWPDDPRSESQFAARIFEDAAVTVGYWGTRDDGPWALHVGDYHHPAAKGY